MKLKIIEESIETPRLLILNLATAIGYMGGFPDPPKQFVELVNRYPLLKWVMVTLLIYQGGGEQDIQIAIELTVVLYLLDKFLKNVDLNKFLPPKQNKISEAKENFY